MGEEFADSVEHVEGAARQPVDPRHRHHVAGGQWDFDMSNMTDTEGIVKQKRVRYDVFRSEVTTKWVLQNLRLRLPSAPRVS
jgi:hypothetical protein